MFDGNMLLYSVALLAGFLVLFKSADYFVVGAVATGTNFHISPMVIGLTVVTLGTSAPEIFVAVTASLQGQPDLAVGNAIGSNIANIGMVLGITALLVPLDFGTTTMRHDLPILVFVTLCAGAALIDFKLDLWDGVLLLVGLVVFLFRIAIEHRSTAVIGDIIEIDDVSRISRSRAFTMLGLSLMCLLISAQAVVWSVIRIAESLGVSELVIALTVVAVGTSLPELVVSVTSALKGQNDLAIGNIIGSNILNILAVLSIPCVLSPAEFGAELLWRDYVVMLAMTLLLVFFAFAFSVKSRISRIEGLLLLTAWVAYLGLLYRSS